MLGGGEQFFQEPPGFSIETLKHYAIFARELRSLTSIKGDDIKKICSFAKEVGDTQSAYELVVGLLFRHIKTWREKKQLGGWYILHQLCRDEPDKYAHEANKYILEVGCDFIPWEDKNLAPKYQALVQKWNTDKLFSQHVVMKIWEGQKDRDEQIRNPDRYRAELQEEEAIWREEDIRQRDDDSKLNEFGQPCLDYMQGNCPWGDGCKQLHPEGMKGTLPPECRLGDWKCVCGCINRHFRRRCSNCPKEKPQYRRSAQLSAEDRLLSAPEDVGDVFRHQFGYDPNNAEEAIKFWSQRLASYSSQQWHEERSDAYRARILGQGAAAAAGGGALSTSAATTTLNFAVEPIAEEALPDEVEPTTKKMRAEGEAQQALKAHQAAITASSQRVRMPNLPNMAAAERIPFISRKIIDSGVADANLGELLYLLTLSIREVASVRGGLQVNVPSASLEPLYTVATLVYSGWNTGKARTVAVPFFEGLFPYLATAERAAVVNAEDRSGHLSLALPKEQYGQLAAALPSDHASNLKAMVKDVTGKGF